MNLQQLIEFIIENYDIKKVIDELEEYCIDSEEEEEEEEELDYAIDDEGFYYLI